MPLPDACFFGCVDEDNCQGLCDFASVYGVITVKLSRAEQEALRDFLPRVQVANVCLPNSPLHTALLKVSPKSLPWGLR